MVPTDIRQELADIVGKRLITVQSGTLGRLIDQTAYTDIDAVGAFRILSNIFFNYQDRQFPMSVGKLFDDYQHQTIKKAFREMGLILDEYQALCVQTTPSAPLGMTVRLALNLQLIGGVNAIPLNASPETALSAAANLILLFGLPFFSQYSELHSRLEYITSVCTNIVKLF